MKKILLSLLLCLPVVASAQTPGANYAVFFYVTDFKPGWASLPETAKEATELKAELETNFSFTCEAVPNPSKAQILAKIKTYNDRLGADDQVLFFFSMHGHYEESAERGFLIAADGALQDDYGDTWLSYDDLSGYLARCKAKHVLLALDACHSGAFGIRNKARPDVPNYAQAEDCNQRVAKTFQFSGRQFCTSGNKSSKTPAKSLFASRFLEALRKGGQDGIIRFDDLEYYLGKVENPRPENGTFKNHEPGGDFVFVRKNACLTLPDRDGDKIPDVKDKCPDDWGSQANGCPIEAGNSAQLAADLADWKNAKGLNTEAAYRAYLSKYPNGEFKTSAIESIQAIEKATALQNDNTAWALAEEKNTLDAYTKYVADYPNGLHQNEADQKTKALSTSEKSGSTVMPDGMVFVKGGKFMMGSPQNEAGRREDEVQHEVELSDFYIGKYEVTQKQWRDVMGDNPSHFKNCDNCPVEQVSWADIQQFIKRLNQQTGRNYRLPTEAEWEYAAREEGKTYLFVFVGTTDKNNLYKYANFCDDNCEYSWKTTDTDGYKNTAPVGKFLPTNIGLHDLSGNVWEWCSDWYGADYYKNSPTKNPTGPDNGTVRVIRGGSWFNNPQSCRAANRYYYAPDVRYNYVGFRLARTN